VKPHLWLIKFIGVIVPRRLRASWRQEWEAELRYRETLLAEWDRLRWRNKFDLLWHSLGAFADALWLQPRRWEDEMIQDLRFALRSLHKHALLSAVVVLTLTLGIGISTGVFGWFNAEFLRARVDKDHASFVRIYSGYTGDPKRPVIPRATTWEDYQLYRDNAKSLGDLTAWGEVTAPFGQDDPAVTRTALVTCNFFSLYDPGPPLLGRLLQSEDCAAASPVVVLSERLWRYRFAANPQVVGRIVHFNDQPVTIVGVAPNYAGMVNGARAWFPLSLESYLKVGNNLLRRGETGWLEVAGLLQRGFSREQAAAEMRLLAAQQDSQHPGRFTTVAVTDGSPIQEPSSGRAQIIGLIFILGILIAFVLIVCVNVTTLLLARAAARQQEIAVRVALGAGRLRLIRMLLSETLLLASIAGLASVYLAYRLPGILLHWLVNPWGEGGGTWYSLAPDWRVFAYLALATMMAGVMAGLTPALQSLKVDLSETLKGRQILTKGSRLYGILIGSQVALSLFLLIGTVLFVRTTRHAWSFGPGFETRQVLWTQLYPPANREQHSWGSFHRTVTEQLSSLPGVQSVAWSHWFPLFVNSSRLNLRSPDQPLRRVAFNTVSANYFSTLEIPIISGRALRDDDFPCDRGGVCSVVVSQLLAREFWPGEASPLGKRLQTLEGNTYEVVGVVRDISSTRLGGLDDPMIYFPWNPSGERPANPFVRFAGDQAATARAVTAAIRSIAPGLPVEAATVHTVREHVLEGLGNIVQLIVFLCAIAVILAIAGIYGVIGFAVSRRTREMGIRLALGAGSMDIYRAVLSTSGRPVAVGLLGGLALSVAAFAAIAPLFRNIEIAIDVWDPVNYAIAVVLLAAAALAAVLGPARRATKIDPLAALRQD
jgi:putative ABC transport system permease protein